MNNTFPWMNPKWSRFSSYVNRHLSIVTIAWYCMDTNEQWSYTMGASIVRIRTRTDTEFKNGGTAVAPRF